MMFSEILGPGLVLFNDMQMKVTLLFFFPNFKRKSCLFAQYSSKYGKAYEQNKLPVTIPSIDEYVMVFCTLHIGCIHLAYALYVCLYRCFVCLLGFERKSNRKGRKREQERVKERKKESFLPTDSSLPKISTSARAGWAEAMYLELHLSPSYACKSPNT